MTAATRADDSFVHLHVHTEYSMLDGAARLGLTRQWLHATQLGFAHPADGRWVEFHSDYPPDLAHALEVLRAES